MDLCLGLATLLFSSSSLLLHDKVGRGMREKQMECGSCGFALHREQDSLGLEGKRQPGWSQYRRLASLAGKVGVGEGRALPTRSMNLGIATQPGAVGVYMGQGKEGA